MATRASLARNTAPKEVYEGRVHKWERRWLVHKKGTIKTEVMLELLRWIVTDEQCPELTGPRHPHIKPLKQPVIKQPSKKPAEQAAEAGAGQQAGPSAGPSTAGPAGAPEAQPPAAQPREQAAEQPTAEQTAAGAPAEQATVPSVKLPPPVQELPPPVQEPTPQANAVADAPAVAGGDAPQGVADAALPPEPHDAAAAKGDPGPGRAPTGDPVAGGPGAEMQQAGEGGSRGAAAMDGVQAPSEAPPSAVQDAEMADTGAAA